MKTCRRKWLVQWLAACIAVVLGMGMCAGLPVSAATSAELTISQNGIDFIKAREGFSAKCYYDGAQSSIGYGTKCGTKAHASGLHSITKAAAEVAMRQEIVSSYIPNVRRQTSGLQMNQNQFDALVSFTYNTGGGTSMIKNSPLVKYLRGEMSQAAAASAFESYVVTNSATGKVDSALKNRRRLEAKLFFSGVNPNPDPVPTKWYDEYSLADVGTDFCAYIINTEAWKHITNESTNNVIMHNENGYAEQIWRFTKNADGSYKIINCKTGYALDRGGSDNNVYVSPDCGNDYQSWYIYGESGAYFFKPRNSDNVMDISGGSVEDGANVGMFEWNGTTAQKFQIWKLDTWTNLGLIQNVGTNFYAYLINVYAWKHITNENNDNVLMRNETAYAEQVWKFIRNDDGSYKIVNCKTGKVIDWDDKSGNVYVNSDNGNDFQKWYIYGESGAYILKPKNSSCVLDITSGSVSDGANVQIYDWNGTTAQKFQIWRLDDYKPIVYGDLNSDNTLTTADAVLLQRYLLQERTLTQTQWQTADLNADGTVNGFDLALLRQKLVA
ncbi:MAG TPA: RICIN domain-containing protein [Oscillospiraceae bacterium]|uniref:RICIN domain-containing protein n=1 Tax=Ruminococcus callidus TaxID=40519 RepID=UPI0039936E56|nr:RICIN domain-containing protein [Oscillospiraceae bacterium]